MSNANTVQSLLSLRIDDSTSLRTALNILHKNQLKDMYLRAVLRKQLETHGDKQATYSNTKVTGLYVYAV